MRKKILGLFLMGWPFLLLWVILIGISGIKPFLIGAGIAALIGSSIYFGTNLFFD